MPLKKSKIRCSICHRWFSPVRSNSKTCSRECSVEYSKRKIIDRYHRLHPKASYGRRTSAGDGKAKKTNAKNTVCKSSGKKVAKGVNVKVDRRSPRSIIRSILQAPDRLNCLTKEEKASVERIMALPAIQRWEAGARNWSDEQRKYAQKIEIKKISSEFSSIFTSFDRKDYGLPMQERKKKKDELPFKYDVLTDDSDDSFGDSDESGDSYTSDDEVQAESTEVATNQVEDEEVDATDEENQF